MGCLNNSSPKNTEAMSNNSMKQIQFTLDAFGPDGLLKEGYSVTGEQGKKIDFIRKYGLEIIIVLEG
jgi:hypothetical protein